MTKLRQRTPTDRVTESTFSELSIRDEFGIWLLNFIEEHVDSRDLDEEKDQEFVTRMCEILHKSNIGCQLVLSLTTALTSRFADRRQSVRDRAAILATLLFKKDEFDVQSRQCLPEYSRFLEGIAISEPKITNSKLSEPFEKSKCVYNDITCMEKPTNALFIQQALAILSERKDIPKMIKIYQDFSNILRRTTPSTFKRVSAPLFNELINLNTPAVYDFQFKSLANFLHRDFSFYDILLEELFKTGLETKQFYIIHTFCHLHTLLEESQQIIMHTKFCTKFVEYPGDFSPIVQRQCEEFILRGMELIYSISPYS